MTPPPSDHKHTPAKQAYRRSLGFAAILIAALASGVVTTDADAKQKKHHNSAGKTSAPKAAAAAAVGSTAATPAASDPAKATPPSSDPVKPEAQSSPKPPEAWSESEIADARAHCAVILQRIHAVALPHAPIREGACGAPAPIELVSIGQNPAVSLSPPAIVRCDLAEQLVNWFEKDVQPLARKHFKSAIVRIETMSSYSCRNAYGRKSTKLSEHGLANALDIGGFVTASALTAEVLDDWGKPQREIVAEAAAQKKAAEEAAAKTAEAAVAGNQAQGGLPSAVSSTTGAAVAGLARSTIIEGAPNSTNIAKTISIRDASRLGGPQRKPSKVDSKPRKTAFYAGAESSTDSPDPEMKAFLHEVHETACRTFGTTLGPEANAAHRNHFHVDMAPRKFTKICD
jgi:hypothetical protein